MDNLVITLGGGVFTAVVLFAILYKFTPLIGKQSAAVVMLLVIGIYIPFAVLNWPGGDIFAIHLAMYLVAPYVLGIITSTREMRLRMEPDKEGAGWFHWGPAVMIVFFFVVATVDAIIITLANKGVDSDVAAWLLPEPQSGAQVTSYFPGAVVNDFHEKEALYNQYLERLRAQRERGWEIEKIWQHKPIINQENTFQMSLKDKDSVAVTAAEIQVDFLRPGDNKQDRTITLQEIEPGIYQHAVTLNLPGLWHIYAHIQRAEEIHEFKAVTRINELATDE